MYSLLFRDQICPGLVNLAVPVAHDAEGDKDGQTYTGVEEQGGGEGADRGIGVELLCGIVLDGTAVATHI
jgi:hypothetical protein